MSTQTGSPDTRGRDALIAGVVTVVVGFPVWVAVGLWIGMDDSVSTAAAVPAALLAAAALVAGPVWWAIRHTAGGVRAGVVLLAVAFVAWDVWQAASRTSA